MLISSGLGSYCSRRLTGDSSNSGRLSAVLIGVALTVTALAYLAAPVSEFGVGWPLPLKTLVTVGLIAPAGFLMGIPFPTGLTRLEQSFPQAVRWAWALNAAASVLGSAAAICLAIYIGLRATVLIGAFLYLCALSVLWLRKSAVGLRSPCRSRSSIMKFAIYLPARRESQWQLPRLRPLLIRQNCAWMVGPAHSLCSRSHHRSRSRYISRKRRHQHRRSHAR